MKHFELEILKPLDTRSLNCGFGGLSVRSVLNRGSCARLAGLWLLLLACEWNVGAQTDYAINWWTLDNGGGTTTGGVYQVRGTIGQSDTGLLTNGTYVLQGGFWGGALAIQTPGAPRLTITRSNGNVILSWPNSEPAWRLEMATDLVAPSDTTWTSIPPPYVTNATGCVVTGPALTARHFYRLHRP